jgi:hypothetical protein
MRIVRKGVWIVAAFCPVLLAFPARAGAGGAPGPSLEGAWLGSLNVSPATSLQIGFLLNAKPDGSLAGTFVSLDEGAGPIALSRVSQENRRVTMDVSAIGGRYEGTLNTEGSQIEGRWTQGSASWVLVLKCIVPQEPQRPYPYLEKEVTYQNAKDGVTLAGTLTLPPIGGPFPAVILITGSGQQRRDASVYGHRLFLVLADYLTRRRIAVPRVDDRGVGGSTGDFAQASSEDFARDVRAGVEYLTARREIDPKRIGLIGHSEGGLIAPLVAADSNEVALIVLMAAPGVTGDLVIESQIVHSLKTAGAGQAAIDATLQRQRCLVDVVKSETDPNRVEQKLRDLGYTDSQIQAATSQWFRFFVTHDPQPTLRQVQCPVLALNGELDVQVFAQDNLPAIEQALREGGNPDFTVQELPGLNHLFQTAQTGHVGEYAFIEETMAPLALETVAAWIEARTKPKP